MTKKQKKTLTRILVTAGLLVVFVLVPWEALPLGGVWRLAGYLAAYLVIGHDILKKAWRGIRNGRMLDENFLMAVATVGAFGLAIYTVAATTWRGWP